MEVDIAKKKKKGLSKFLDKAPGIRDLEIRERLNKLCEKSTFFNRGNAKNTNHNVIETFVIMYQIIESQLYFNVIVK